MKKILRPVCALVLGLGAAAFGAAPEEYIITNITGWTDAQLATLPHFDRYVPVKPAGASADFVGVCANGMGLTAGNRSGESSAVDDGAMVDNGTQTNIPAWGTYNWHYSIFDGHDTHHYWGSVTRSPVRGANVLGQIAGYATLPGGGSGVGSTDDYDDHIYLREASTGEHLDLTPTAHRADPRDLNDVGGITGTWSDASNSHPFRRSADGTFTDFVFDESFSHYIVPAVINNHGVVAGMVTVWTTPRDYIPFISESGSTTAALPYPDEAKAYNAVIADINDHDVIVGNYYAAATTPKEPSALRWSRDGAIWIAEDLNDFLDDNMDFILDGALAVNDAGHIIVGGHADGGPDNSFNTHRFLLTPKKRIDDVLYDDFAPPAVTTLPVKNVTSTSAVMRGKINAANLATTWHFDHGMTTGYGTATTAGAAAGTAPVLGEMPLTGLQPHTTYHYRATGNNAEGTRDGADVSFTTAWTWTAWAAANLGGAGAAGPQGDENVNGLPDLLDYGTGVAVPPEFVIEANKMKVTFRHLLLAEGVTLVVQVSDDLVNWEDGSSYGYGVSTPSNDFSTQLSRVEDGVGGEIIEVEVEVDAGASVTRRFVRIVARSS